MGNGIGLQRSEPEQRGGEGQVAAKEALVIGF
jgi:hypothetical protein